MDSVTTWNPTRFVFGKNTENQVGIWCRKNAATKVMLIHNSGSAMRYGLLDRVKDSIIKQNISYIEMGDIEDHARLSCAQRGIGIARREKVDFVLAIGGGNVINIAKAIAAGSTYKGEVWDFFESPPTPITDSLPVACIVTNVGTGAESSDLCLLSNDVDGFAEVVQQISDFFKLKFVILNPELTYTVPSDLLAQGIANSFLRILETYFANKTRSFVCDQLNEGLLRTIIHYKTAALASPPSYEAMAQVMWASVLADNAICGEISFPNRVVHKRACALGQKHEMPNGAILAAACLSWLNEIYLSDTPRLVRYATEVWGVTNNPYDQASVALNGIRQTEGFLISLKLPIVLEK